mmetsp:Transcript_41554/g.120369  ORF Transcript_41554/g.120369 Transcript_41554/m.120369 type:complete len:234 (-) Transcript_41554:35-736(-)
MFLVAARSGACVVQPERRGEHALGLRPLRSPMHLAHTGGRVRARAHRLDGPEHAGELPLLLKEGLAIALARQVATVVQHGIPHRAVAGLSRSEAERLLHAMPSRIERVDQHRLLIAAPGHARGKHLDAHAHDRAEHLGQRCGIVTAPQPAHTLHSPMQHAAFVAQCQQDHGAATGQPAAATQGLADGWVRLRPRPMACWQHLDAAGLRGSRTTLGHRVLRSCSLPHSNNGMRG